MRRILLGDEEKYIDAAILQVLLKWTLSIVEFNYSKLFLLLNKKHEPYKYYILLAHDFGIILIEITVQHLNIINLIGRTVRQELLYLMNYGLPILKWEFFPLPLHNQPQRLHTVIWDAILILNDQLNIDV